MSLKSIRSAGVLSVAVGSWLAAACGSGGDESSRLAQAEQPLLSDFDRCGDGRLDDLAQSCSTAAGNDVVTTPGQSLVPSTLHSVQLADNGSGQFEGTFPLSLGGFGSGEYVFYLGTPNVDFQIFQRAQNQTFIEVAPICSRYISDTLATSLTGATCPPLRGAYVFELSAANTYEVRFGPISPQRTIRVLAQRTRSVEFNVMPGPDRIVRRACTAADLTQLDALALLCTTAQSTTPFNASTFDTPDAPDVQLDTAYGLHLRALGDQNEGAVEFVPPHTGDYILGLGTAADIRVTQGSETDVIFPDCGLALGAGVAQSLIGQSCDPLRATYLVRLRGGEGTRVELGRISPAHWIRFAVRSVAPDSDNDGWDDLNDECPQDPNKIVRGACDCDVVDTDTDGDGIPDCADPCPDEAGTGGAACPRANVGYYDLVAGEGVAPQVEPIEVAGGLPLNLGTLGASDLAGIDVLFAQNPSILGFGSEYLNARPAIDAAVQAGMILVLHDARVSSAPNVLPGGSTFSISRSTLDPQNVDILDATTLVTNGPGGLLTQTSLDGGDPSNTGFANSASLPLDAVKILSLSNPARIATFCYARGSGAVLYSTIPLHQYLDGSSNAHPDVEAMMKAYATNVVAYALAGACAP